MFVDFEQEGDVCILRMTGRFATGQDAEYLRGKTDELKRNGYRKIVADLANVAYVDSTGIGFLIGIYTGIVKDKGNHFVLASPNPRVKEVLTITKLSAILPTYPTVPEAVTSLQGC
jgi:anti-anti-sigma factor